MTGFGGGAPNFGDPFAGGFGAPPAPSYPPPQGQWGAPPQDQWTAPTPPISSGRLWPTVALGAGVVGVAVAVVPFYADVPLFVGVIGGVAGVLGIVAGVVGLMRARQSASRPPVLAVSGVVAASLAVVLAVLTVLVDVNTSEQPTPTAKPPDGDHTYSTDEVLNDQLEVAFGEFEYTTDPRGGRVLVEDSRLPVTVRNKLDTRRSFQLNIAGFEGEHEQVDDDSDFFNLDAGATQTIDFFTVLVEGPEVAERLKTADFRVVMATSNGT